MKMSPVFLSIVVMIVTRHDYSLRKNGLAALQGQILGTGSPGTPTSPGSGGIIGGIGSKGRYSRRSRYSFRCKVDCLGSGTHLLVVLCLCP